MGESGIDTAGLIKDLDLGSPLPACPSWDPTVYAQVSSDSHSEMAGMQQHNAEFAWEWERERAAVAGLCATALSAGECYAKLVRPRLCAHSAPVHMHILLLQVSIDYLTFRF